MADAAWSSKSEVTTTVGTDRLNFLIDPATVPDNATQSVDNFVASHGLAAFSNFVVIKSEADFPAPSGGVIDLTPLSGTTFYIDGVVVCTNRFTMNGGFYNFVSLTTDATLTVVALIHAGTGTFFTIRDTGDVTFTHINLASVTGSQLFDYDEPTTPTSGFLSLQQLTVANFGNLGTVSNYLFFGFFNGCVITGTSVNGLVMGGVNGIWSLEFTITLGNAGTLVDLDTAIFAQTINYITVDFDTPVGATALDGAVTASGSYAGNLLQVTNGRGNVTNCIFRGAGTGVSGVTIKDIGWKFLSNTGLGDSTAAALCVGDNPLSTPTVIADLVTPVTLAADTFTLDAPFTQRFTSTLGVLEYVGLDTVEVLINANLKATVASGSNRTLVFEFFLNGTVIPDTDFEITILSSGTFQGFQMLGAVTLSTGDTVEIRVTNTTAVVNVIIDRLKFIPVKV